MNWFDELERVSAAPETAVRVARRVERHGRHRALARVTDAAPGRARARRVRGPVRRGPPARGRDPRRRFLPLQGRNHILLADERAWPCSWGRCASFWYSRRPPPSHALAGSEPP